MGRRLVTCTAVLAAMIVSLWLTAGAALAAGPPSSPALPSASAPAKARLRLYLAGTFAVHHDLVTVAHRLVEVKGFVRPYVPGQWVKLKATVGRRRFASGHLRVKPVGRNLGGFEFKLNSPAAGIVRVTALHARTRQMVGFIGRRAVAALNPQAGPGSRGLFVDLVQQRLAALHIYMPRSGVFDQQTTLALDAYHRLLGWGEGHTSLDARTIADLLDGRGTFHVRHPRDGHHAEGDLASQLLALINGTHVQAIYPISSGKPSTPTVLGHFRIWYRVPGYLPDGMYFSSFFYQGYAIHGYDPAPDYPASHGCMRLPISDAISVFRWLAMGDWVDVYY
ncbi:MAG TPA: L,D-transpeptidase [Solirubrobacteraceae bacterium]|nr:L,D-transpeptidase [Solirubrobacteraceae bacterium]